MSDPVVCDQPWLSDPARRCRGRPFRSAGGPCFAHDAAVWRDLLSQLQRIDLVGSEVTGEFLAALAGALRNQSPHNVDLADAVIVGDLDISNGVLGTVIANGAHFCGVVLAHGTRFAERASFTRAKFGSFHAGVATFETDVSFHDATFHGDAFFPGTRFGGHADFANATFGPHADSDTTDGGWSRDGGRAVHGADFTDAVFAAPASFHATTAHHAMTFERVVFHDRVDFDHLRGARVHFVDAHFERTASFNAAELDGPIFDRCRFQRDSSFITTALRPLPTPGSVATPMVFANVTFEGDVELVTTGTVGLRDTVLHSNVTVGAETIVMAGLQLRAPLQITLLDSTTLRVCQLTPTHPLTIYGSEPPGGPLTTLGELTDSTLLAPLTLTDVALTHTSFTRSTGLEQLRVDGGAAWRRRHGRRILADEMHLTAASDARARRAVAHELTATYRQLRAGLETSKAAPAAADFYYGEMEMRRLAAPLSFERGLLALYKWLGGYGVRAWRPFATYVGLLAVTTKLLHARTNWFATTALTDTGAASLGGAGGLAFDRYGSLAAFVTRNSVSLFSAPAEGLTAAGTFLFIGERFASVTLLGLAVLALRARVQR